MLHLGGLSDTQRECCHAAGRSPGNPANADHIYEYMNMDAVDIYVHHIYTYTYSWTIYTHTYVYIHIPQDVHPANPANADLMNMDAVDASTNTYMCTNM